MAFSTIFSLRISLAKFSMRAYLYKNLKQYFESKPIYSKWIIFSIFAIGFTYSLSVYFLKFFCFTNREKLVIFCGLFIFVFSILFLFFEKTLKKSGNLITRQSAKRKFIIIILAFGLSLTTTLSSLSSIPTKISLKLTIPENSRNQYDILEIKKIGTNIQKEDRISPYDLALKGNWIIEDNIISISSTGGESLKYSEPSNIGLSLLFQKSPESGEVEINYNGISQIINLQNSDYALKVVDLPFSYFKMSPDRIFWVFILLFSNFISLFFFSFVILTIFNLCQDFSEVFTKTSFFQKLILITIPLVICFGFADYSYLSRVGVFHIRRKNSNSLLALSDAEFAYMHVFYNFSKYFNGYELVIPKGLLAGNSVFPKNRISEDQLLEIGQLDSVVEENYSSELSMDQLESIKNMQRISLLPSMYVIPYGVEFILESNSQNKVVCLWGDNETIYFIPNQYGFYCQKGK